VTTPVTHSATRKGTVARALRISLGSSGGATSDQADAGTASEGMASFEMRLRKTQ
jgi:hypothetical protein